MKKYFLLYFALSAFVIAQAQIPDSVVTQNGIALPRNFFDRVGGIEAMYDTIYSKHGNTRMLTCIQKYVNHTPDVRSMPPFTPEGSITYVFIKNNSADTVIYHSLNRANSSFDFSPRGKAKPTEHYTDFKTGKALVTDSAGAYFLINRAGETLSIPWQTAMPLGNGLQKVSIIVDNFQVYALADKNGKQLGGLQYRYMENPVNGVIKVSETGSPYGPFGLMDTTGKIIVPMVYTSLETGDGACVVSTGGGNFNTPRKFGIVNYNGRVVVPCTYDYMEPFSEGLAAARLGEKWGYLNAEGETVIAFKYDYTQAFANGLGAVAVSGQYGFIDKTGEIQIPLKFKRVSPFRDGLAIAFTSLNRDTCGMIDTKGNWVIPPVYFDIYPFKDGLTIAHKAGEGPRMIDKQNRIQYPGYVAYGNAYMKDSYFNDSVALFHEMNSRETVLMNKAGKVILNPGTLGVEFLHDETTQQMLPYLKVRNDYYMQKMLPSYQQQESKDYRWGIMDFTGKMVVECKYTEMRHFINGWLPVRSSRDRNNLWGFIDENFNEDLTHKFVRIEEYTGNGLIRVQEDYNTIFINRKGERLKPLASW